MTDQTFGSNEVGSSVTRCLGKASHWIEIQLVGEDDKPIAGEKYKITLSDGTTTIEGSLDENGLARVDGLVEPGTCKITFPSLDKDAWQNT